jgi:hypothetical protein
MSTGMGHQRSGDAVSLCIGFWCTFLAGRLINPSGIRGALNYHTHPYAVLHLQSAQVSTDSEHEGSRDMRSWIQIARDCRD